MFNFRQIVEEEIDKSIVPISEENKYAKRRRNELGNAVLDKVKGSEELRGAASNIGINPDYSEEGRDEFKGQNFNGDNSFKKEAAEEANRKHKAAIRLLRKFITRSPEKTARGESVLVPGGAIAWDKLKVELANHPQKYENLTYDEVCKIKDNLDLHNMRGAYDPTIRSAGEDKFGTFKANKDDEFLNVDNFDFNDIYSAKQIKAGKKTEGQKPLRSDEDAILHIKKVTAERYINTHYGIKMDIPSVSLGNKKVKNAMIINFTSAFRCPAWNDCLVKHACYARSGEMQHNNVKHANDRRNLMWLSAAGDEEMMKLIHGYLLSYLVSWSKVEKKIKPILSEEFMAKVGELSGQDLDGSGVGAIVEAMSKMWCHEIVGIPGMEKIIEESLSVKDIRINENGDFINQSMLEEFDQYIAGEFALIGVTCAAYSCRNLQFGRIKNIIINASRTGMRDSEGENAGNTIERYFVAMPTEMYDCFEDTFNGYEVESDDIGSIGRLKQPKPLYKVVEGPDGAETYGEVRGYYYKCPCAREDFSMNGEKFNVNCYNCHMCYERVNVGDIKKMFVFVRAHGSEREYIGQQREKFIKKHMGVSAGYFEKAKASKEQGKLKEGVEPMDENLLASMEQEGLQTITDNAIMSMTQHFSEIGKQNNKFNEIYERLKNPIKG